MAELPSNRRPQCGLSPLERPAEIRQHPYGDEEDADERLNAGDERGVCEITRSADWATARLPTFR